MKNFLLKSVSVLILCLFSALILSSCSGKSKDDVSAPVISDTSAVSDSALTPVVDVSEPGISESEQTPVVYQGDMNISGTDRTPVISRIKTKYLSNAPGVMNPDYRNQHYIVVYCGSQSVVVYGKNENGNFTEIIKSFTCSTGKKGSAHQGLYRIGGKYRWRYLGSGLSGQYSCSLSKSYLFHSVPYTQLKENHLADEEYDKLGTPASHGCIRLCVRDAKWLFDNCAVGTQANITFASGPEGAGVPRRNPNPAYDGWDPTDKWAEGNPYYPSAAKPEPSE